MALGGSFTTCIFVVLLSVCCNVDTWQLRANPSNVIPWNSRSPLDLVCSYSPPSQAAIFKSVTRIHITKLEADGASKSFASADTAAGVMKYSNTRANVSVSGLILTVEWGGSDLDEAVGSYGCIINGKDTSDRPLEYSVKPLIISKAKMTVEDVFSEVRNHEKNMKQLIKVAVEGAEKRMDDKLEAVDASYNAKLSQIQRNLSSVSITVGETETRIEKALASLKDLNERVEKLKHVAQTTSPTSKTTTAGPDEAWPADMYAMLKPETGCYDDGAWQTGRIDITTESSDPSVASLNNASAGHHLARPLFERHGAYNVATLRYCVKTTSDLKAWPKGSFCLNRVSDACPQGFASGGIQYDVEDDGLFDRSSKLPDTVADLDFKTIFFCCRDDGNPGNGVLLPRSKPFYLYRFGGTCQQVYGMSVSEETVSIDTEHSNTKNVFHNKYHPDTTPNPMTTTLCYYQPS